MAKYMIEYIDKKKAIYLVEKAVSKADAMMALLRMDPADVVPVKKAEWIYGEDDGQDGWYCSECRFFIPWYYSYYGLDNIDFIKDYHTCPHCNSKMVTYTGADRRGKEDGR